MNNNSSNQKGFPENPSFPKQANALSDSGTIFVPIKPNFNVDETITTREIAERHLVHIRIQTGNLFELVHYLGWQLQGNEIDHTKAGEWLEIVGSYGDSLNEVRERIEMNLEAAKQAEGGKQ